MCVCVCRWRTEAQRPPGASSTGSTGASTWGPSSPWEAWPTSSRTSALSWATSSPPPASASPSWCSCWAVPSSSPSPRTAAPSQRCSRSWASPVAPPGYPRSPACYGEEGRKGETVGGGSRPLSVQGTKRLQWCARKDEHWLERKYNSKTLNEPSV